jgi:signal transduction histidine kinase
VSRLRKWWKEKRIDFYISAVIIPSILLSFSGLWALEIEYRFVNDLLEKDAIILTSLTAAEIERPIREFADFLVQSVKNEAIKRREPQELAAFFAELKQGYPFVEEIYYFDQAANLVAGKAAPEILACLKEFSRERNPTAQLVKAIQLPKAAQVILVACAVKGFGFTAFSLNRSYINGRFFQEAFSRLPQGLKVNVYNQNGQLLFGKQEAKEDLANRKTLSGLGSLYSISTAIAGGEQDIGGLRGARTFAFYVIIYTLVVILVLGTFLSTRDMQRSLEFLRLKNDFISTVSHELKTPLASIRLLAERLPKLGPNEQDKQKEYYEHILAQSFRLKHLIENILDFSKIEEGREKYKFERAELNALVKETTQSYPLNLMRADCAIKLALLPSEIYVSLDKETFARAIFNLLDNAVKFSPQNGTVSVFTKVQNSDSLVEVIDQGPGIEPQEKKKLFEKFYHKGKGTGLGLTLTKRIIEDHRGRIELESEPGKGSTFRLILPLAA